MRVTSKGQVTIPIAIRRKYGITANSEVAFVESADGPVIRLVPAEGEDPGERVVRVLREAGRHADKGLTTDEIMRLTRGWGEHDPGFDSVEGPAAEHERSLVPR